MAKITFGAALVAAWLALTGVARAEPSEQDTIAKVVELNREGVAQYQKKHYDAARKVLKQALDLCESAGLDRHPVAARTHIHLGIVIIAGFGQREIGSRQFNEALQIDPNISLTPGLATPAAQDVFNESLVAVSPKSAPRPAAPVETAPAAQATDAPVAQATDAPAAQATDAPAAQADEAPRGSSPRRAPETAQADDEAAPTVRRAAAPKRAEDEEDDGGAASGGLASRVQIGVLLGGGVGWASGVGDVNHDTNVSGSFAAAKLGHLEVEGGYWLTDELMLSLAGRFQMVTGPTVIEANMRTYHPASYATAIFAQGTWSPSTGPLRPYVSGALGAGRIRHVVTLSQLKDCGPNRNEVCVDTIGAGPLLAGVGGGLMYDLGQSFALVAAINTQVAAPTFTFNIDLNAGLAFRL